MSLLEVRELSRHFGGLAAVNNLSFIVDEGEIHGLIGPNGAGKTTTFNVISGFYKPTAGEILFGGRRISGLRPSRIAARGVVRTFQATTLFQELSVFENVLIGCHMQSQVGPFGALLGTSRRAERASEVRAAEILEFMGLGDRRDDETVNLPHGHQRALGIAVAIAAEPKLILLDEPFTGMNPEETRQMMVLVERVRSQGCHHSPRGARHAGGHGPLRPDHGAELRRVACARNAHRDPLRPGGDRSLSGNSLNAVSDQVSDGPL